MTSTAYQISLVKYAQRKQCKPHQLSDAELTFVAVSARSVQELAQDGIKAFVSRAKTTIFRVPLFVLTVRTRICKQECEHGKVSKDGNVFCDLCGCCGGWMRAALNDASESCRLPEGQKKWGKYKDLNNTGLPHAGLPHGTNHS